MSAVANALGVSRQHLLSARRKAAARRCGRPPLPEEELVARSQALIADLLTYGYRRIHASCGGTRAMAGHLRPMLSASTG